MSFESCRHIMSSGDQCGSPRISNRDFCYFHNRMHSSHRTAIEGSRSTDIMVPVLDRTGALLGMEPATRQTLDLGLLEDRASVQIAISTVLNALAAGHLHERRATALLYGLQLASSNCRATSMPHGYAEEPVDTVVETASGLTLAPADRVPLSTLHRQELNNETFNYADLDDLEDDDDDSME